MEGIGEDEILIETIDIFVEHFFASDVLSKVVNEELTDPTEIGMFILKMKEDAFEAAKERLSENTDADSTYDRGDMKRKEDQENGETEGH